MGRLQNDVFVEFPKEKAAVAVIVSFYMKKDGISVIFSMGRLKEFKQKMGNKSR